MNEKLFHHHDPEISPSHEAPSWAIIIQKQMALLLREIRQMKQSTSDLIDATNALIANSAKVDTAIDALVDAQANGDEDAIKTQIAALQSLKTDQDTHLSKLVVAAPIAVAAPADPAPVSVGPTT